MFPATLAHTAHSEESESDRAAALTQVTASRPTRFHTPEPTEPPQPSLLSQPPSYPKSFSHTPATKLRGTSSGAYLTASKIETKRTILLSGDVPRMIPEISVDSYFERVLPPLAPALTNHVDTILNALERKGVVDVDRDRWAAFPLDPAEATEHESVVFQGLTTIFNAVVDIAKEIESTLEQTFCFLVTGPVPVYSDRGAGDSQPDGFNKIIFTSSPVKEDGSVASSALQEQQSIGSRSAKNHFVYDIVNPQQFKLQEDTSRTNDDVAKLCYDMTQILALDPCRRFTFGTTIENCTTRLWFLSHATLLKTAPFDFMKDRRRLVRLFLSLAFASSANMGWDPTITFDHMGNDDRRQYKIEVDGKYYITLRVLSDFAADSPLGRATRVWKVINDEGNIHVLKDVWLDHSRMEEHKIREAILEDVQRLKNGQRYAEVLKNYMFTPIAYGKVHVGGLADDTTDVMLGGYNVVEGDMVPLITPTPAANKNTTGSMGMRTPADRDSLHSHPLSDVDEHSPNSSSQTPRRTILFAPDKVDKNKLTHHRRYHYRVVFKEYAKTIYEERGLDNIFRALAEVVKALWILHKAGWVHRDISGGNVYWYQEGQTGLIGDFEYAKVGTDRGRHDVRTGTPFFMAAETLHRKYLFEEDEPLSIDEADPFEDPPDFDKTWADNQPVMNSTACTTPLEDAVPFHHNPLHDLESVWWIIIYILFFNDHEESLSPAPEARQHQMERLFDGQLENMARFTFLKDPHGLREAKQYLCSNFCDALDLLENFRTYLKTAYRKSEKTYPQEIDHTHFFIHNSLLKSVLQNPAYMERLSSIKLVPVKVTALKRKDDTEQDGRPSKRSRISHSTGLKSNANFRQRNGTSSRSVHRLAL
ncbi:hypothetical protein DFH05DRAFT_1472306 [Lentinula detonsa]|uniref:Fungal-type protein kinase domain-containing protein n=1 Tax=Lentinula detonsa TaxID=2804962 RepID=A0A9W8P768_9AGAR|nr:hypothetical protein DFH05DRAFT_1472306 [Lentinula detonsa]